MISEIAGLGSAAAGTRDRVPVVGERFSWDSSHRIAIDDGPIGSQFRQADHTAGCRAKTDLGHTHSDEMVGLAVICRSRQIRRQGEISLLGHAIQAVRGWNPASCSQHHHSTFRTARHEVQAHGSFKIAPSVVDRTRLRRCRFIDGLQPGSIAVVYFFDSDALYLAVDLRRAQCD
jgi:hypothetical protein